MQNINWFLEFPRKRNKKEDITHVPFCLGITVSWSDYDFELCDTEEYFPRGAKKGKHKLSIMCGIFYWWIKLSFYFENKK